MKKSNIHILPGKLKKGETMDTKNLLKKGNRWYLNFTFPGKFGIEALAGRKIRISLETADYKQALSWRKTYIDNLIEANSKVQFLERLANHITEADKELEALLDILVPRMKIKRLSGKDRESLTLAPLIEKYLGHLKNSDLKPSTVSRYRSALDCFCFVLGADATVNAIGHGNIQDFVTVALKLPVGYNYQGAASPYEVIEKSQGKRTLSVSGVNFSLVVIKSMFAWAVEDEILQKNPVKTLSVYLGEAKQKHKLKPTHEQAELLCSLPRPALIDPVTWKCVPIFGRYLGARIGEISQISVDSVITKHGVRCIQVSGELKTEGSARIIPVSDKLAPYLDELLKNRKSGRLFDCKDFTKNGFTKYGHGFLKKFNSAAKKIGDFSFHCFRVYANSEMLDGGAVQTDCERILGHKSERVNSAYVSDDVKRLLTAVNKIQ